MGTPRPLGGRKVQLRVDDHDESKLWLVLKYGGDLTLEGELQAQRLGKEFLREAQSPARRLGKEFFQAGPGGAASSSFRGNPPDEEEGVAFVDEVEGVSENIFRMNPYKLNLQTADDGAQLGTAAVFAKALLGAKGHIAQTAAAYVQRIGIKTGDASHRKHLIASRAQVFEVINSNIEKVSEVVERFDEEPVQTAVRQLMARFGSLYQGFAHVVDILRRVDSDHPVASSPQMEQAVARWVHLADKFGRLPGDLPGISRRAEQAFNVSLLPNLHWSLRYETVNNKQGMEGLFSRETLNDLQETVGLFARIVIPNEFGFTRSDKSRIACHILRPYARMFLDQLLCSSREVDQHHSPITSSAELSASRGVSSSEGGSAGGTVRGGGPLVGEDHGAQDVTKDHEPTAQTSLYTEFTILYVI